MSPAVQQLFEAAEQSLAAGDAAAALDCYRRLLSDRLAQRAPGAAPGALDMVAMERVADLATLLGISGPAEDILEAIRAWFAACGNRVSADYATVKLVSLRIARGRVRQAYEALGSLAGLGDLDEVEFTETGLDEFERRATLAGTSADRAVLLSRLFLEMGRILAANGQYESALVSARRGLRHCAPAAPSLARQAVVPLRLLIAAAALEKGDLPASEEALAHPALQAGPDQPGFAVRAAELRGKAQLLRGRLGAAKASFEGVVDLCRQRGFEAAEIAATLNLAHVLVYLNQTSRARDLLSAAVDAAQRRGDQALAVRAQFLLAVGASRAQSMAEGVPIAPSIFELWGQQSGAPGPAAPPQWKNPFDLPASDNYLALFEDRALGFHWHLASLDWPRAAAYLDELRAAFDETDSTLIHLRLRVLQAMLAYYQGDFAAAGSAFEQLCPQLDRAGLLPELWQALRFLSWSWSRLGRVEAARAVRADADAALAAVSQSLGAADRGMFHLNKWTAEEEFAAGEIRRLAQARQSAQASLPVLRQWRQWKVARAMGALLGHVDRFHAGLTARFVDTESNPRPDADTPIVDTASSPRPASAVSTARWPRNNAADADTPIVDTASSPRPASAVSTARWLWNHARDTATLRFVVLPDCVLVVRAYRFALDFGVCPVTRIQVREAVRCWHEAMLDGGGMRRANSAMRELSDALQLPAIVAGLPARIRHLRIVPDDALYGLPFAAVRVGDRYLVEKYALSIGGAPLPPKPPVPPLRTALAVGVSTGLPGMAELPAVASEIADVSQCLRSAGYDVTVLAADATVPAVSRLLPQAAVCHLACHGIFEPDRPDRSGLILGGEGEARVLSARELSRLDLAGLRQIVLSSCWSADSFVLPGRWVISLPSILLYAGARSIIASLWEVDDRLARGFMLRLYERLRTGRRDEALRLTQIDCLTGKFDGVDAADPIYWAGYALYGESGNLAPVPKR